MAKERERQVGKRESWVEEGGKGKIGIGEK